MPASRHRPAWPADYASSTGWTLAVWPVRTLKMDIHSCTENHRAPLGDMSFALKLQRVVG